MSLGPKRRAFVVPSKLSNNSPGTGCKDTNQAPRAPLSSADSTLKKPRLGDTQAIAAKTTDGKENHPLCQLQRPTLGHGLKPLTPGHGFKTLQPTFKSPAVSTGPQTDGACAAHSTVTEAQMADKPAERIFAVLHTKRDKFKASLGYDPYVVLGMTHMAR